MFYILHGERQNGKVCLPATNQQIIDWCLANPEVAAAIVSKYEDKEYGKWLEDVTNELSHKLGMSYNETKEVMDELTEVEALYHSGIRNIAEAADELKYAYIGG